MWQSAQQVSGDSFLSPSLLAHSPTQLGLQTRVQAAAHQSLAQESQGPGAATAPTRGGCSETWMDRRRHREGAGSSHFPAG